jgi:chemotaxis protein MotA
MFVVIGFLIVIIGILGGYLIYGGNIMLILQVPKLIMIGGAALGSVLAAAPPRILKKILRGIKMIFGGERYTENEYLNLLKTLFELFHVATREGLINVEQHVENPAESSIFKKNQFLLKNKHALNYLCDTMKVMISGGIPPHEIEMLLEADIDTQHQDEAHAPALIQKLGDSLPGIGIVVAVLGIILAMEAIDGPVEIIGRNVGAALVGTMMGVLLAYGFVLPLATNLETLQQSESRYLECIKSAIVAYAKGNAPVMVVEFARRVIYEDVRPSFEETEKAVRSLKG